MFRQEVLENRYIEEFLKDIHRNYAAPKQSTKTNRVVFSGQMQAVLNEIAVNLITLENEVNTSIQEVYPQDVSEKS